ncbi:hypothetical protein FIBSPDRAFT_926258 [Athelia psychrophila]|uniref:Uncharacterized protein n=1 Tax=Athelia psychrophila TaxID=1759441 RepID=A0A166TNF8_9AGAM|nr:hypothetical protein FIBSPDRAFT_926258 [Fibularhizoctonia sp. CBS 109695]
MAARHLPPLGSPSIDADNTMSVVVDFIPHKGHQTMGEAQVGGLTSSPSHSCTRIKWDVPHDINRDEEAQYELEPFTPLLRRLCRIDFSIGVVEVSMLANSMSCINEICVNSCAMLLQRMFEMNHPTDAATTDTDGSNSTRFGFSPLHSTTRSVKLNGQLPSTNSGSISCGLLSPPKACQGFNRLGNNRYGRLELAPYSTTRSAKLNGSILVNISLSETLSPLFRSDGRAGKESLTPPQLFNHDSFLSQVDPSSVPVMLQHVGGSFGTVQAESVRTPHLGEVVPALPTLVGLRRQYQQANMPHVDRLPTSTQLNLLPSTPYACMVSPYALGKNSPTLA